MFDQRFLDLLKQYQQDPEKFKQDYPGAFGGDTSGVQQPNQPTPTPAPDPGLRFDPGMLYSPPDVQRGVQDQQYDTGEPNTSHTSLPVDDSGWLSSVLGGSPFSGGGSSPLGSAGGKDWGSMLMALGGGIASGAGQGWGAGLGAGFTRAAAVNQSDKARAQSDALAHEQMAQAYKIAQMREATQGKTGYGLQVQWGVDKDGNPIALQAKNTGGMEAAPLPEGVTISKTPIKMDIGTGYVLLDPITRQVIGTVPKELQQAAKDKAQGALEGAATNQLPATLSNIDQAIATIDAAIQSPGREGTTGGMKILGYETPIPNPKQYMRGTQERDFVAIHNQIKGKVFLQAYQDLKGGGSITEIEGQKAEQAIARLDTATSDEAYLSALNELRDILVKGRERAFLKAGQQPPGGGGGATGSVPGAGASGDFTDYKDYFGGQ